MLDKIKHIRLNSPEIDNIQQFKYYYNPFIKLKDTYCLPNNLNWKELKDFLIEKFIQERWEIMNQYTILHKKNLNKVSLWNTEYLPIYDYSFHVIFENENDGILTFFYTSDNYNHENRIYHNLEDIEIAINTLAKRKWKFELIIQKWKPFKKFTTNTKSQLIQALAA